MCRFVGTEGLGSQFGWQPKLFGFLLGRKVELMFLHWREDAKIALHPAGVIVADVTFDHLDQLLFAGKPFAIVTFPF